MRPMSVKRRQSTKRMAQLRKDLNERCQGECERCGYPLELLDDGTYLFDAHHRQQRSTGRGNLDTLTNVVACHHTCHVVHRKSIHQDIQQATADGFLVPSWGDPERTALLYKGILSWLKPDGRVVPVTRMYRLDGLSDSEAQLVWETTGEAAADFFGGIDA